RHHAYPVEPFALPPLGGELPEPARLPSLVDDAVVEPSAERFPLDGHVVAVPDRETKRTVLVALEELSPRGVFRRDHDAPPGIWRCSAADQSVLAGIWTIVSLGEDVRARAGTCCSGVTGGQSQPARIATSASGCARCGK